MALLNLAVGALIFGYLLGGLFFLRFWHRTHERLFLIFAIAFWLMALNQLALVFLSVPKDEAHFVYLIRISAFALIAYAIVRKNMQEHK